MNWLQEITHNPSLQTKLSDFLTIYGTSGLEQALQAYADMQQLYTCRSKTAISQIRINDIYYLEIHGHTITAHTAHDVYHKYGALSNELKSLARYGFIKCSQSCIVSLNKIRTIVNNDITLVNDEVLHLSRSCAPKVILAFHNFSHS